MILAHFFVSPQAEPTSPRSDYISANDYFTLKDSVGAGKRNRMSKARLHADRPAPPPTLPDLGTDWRRPSLISGQKKCGTK
jgi:hypothetical protein